MLFNIKKLVYFLITLYIILVKCSYGQSVSSKKIVSIGINYSRIHVDGYVLELKPGINFSLNRILTSNKFKFIIGVEYYQKGASFSFFSVDTIHSEVRYFDKKPYMNLNYIGTNLIVRKQILQSRFFFGIKYNLNYLFSGSKYYYQYDMPMRALIQEKLSVFNQNSNILYSKSLYKFEHTLGAHVTFKVPYIARSYFNIGYDRSISGIYPLIKTTNHSFYLSYSYLF